MGGRGDVGEAKICNRAIEHASAEDGLRKQEDEKNKMRCTI